MYVNILHQLNRTLLVQFVDAKETDYRFFERPYFMAPADELAGEGCVVIRDALKKTGKVGGMGWPAHLAGNKAALSGAVTNPVGILGIDTIAPMATTVTASPGTADLGASKVVTLTANFSKAVTVTGTSTLQLNEVRN